MTDIILSICIPTYNRAENLKNTIQSIVGQTAFQRTNEVEIIISDNCSDDNTTEIVKNFIDKYPSKIKYHRNDKNIIDLNFEKALSLGSGKMLKLNNDTLHLNPGGLDQLLQIVKHCINNDLTPFFLNGKDPSVKERVILSSKASFISKVSYLSTWIAGFCVLRESFKQIDNFSRDAELKLVQVDVLMRLLEGNHKFWIIPDSISTSLDPPKKGGYNLTQVFLENYFKILARHLTSESDLVVLKKEKSKILNKFILPIMVSLRPSAFNNTSKFTFDNSNYKENIIKEFSYFIYLKFEIKLKIGILLAYGKKMLKK